MLDVLLDAFIDSLKTFGIVFIIYLVMSIVEHKLSKKMTLNSKLSPALGGLIGLIPQCGFSIIASDLYKKRHITLGTLIAIFIVCSDEAIPLILTNPEKIGFLIPLIILKLVIGVGTGYLIDYLYKNSGKEIENHIDHCDHHDEVHYGCCNHEIDSHKENSSIKNYIVHPIMHSLKIFVFVLLINVLFGTLVFYTGENKITYFLSSNKYLSPIFSSIIGLIPNCASSVVLTKLFFENGLVFGAYFSGLCCNAGLGLIYLFKHKGLKENISIVLLLLIISIISGYAIMFTGMLI